jgi:hypothetical protein
MDIRTVHVIPMGLEVDRVLGGLKWFPTNRAILVYGKDEGADIEKKARKNGERIKKMVSATIDVEEIMLDIFEFHSSCTKLTSLFQGLILEGYDVYVNISTGNRILSSAALLSCFMTGSHPYYVRPEEYSIPHEQEVLSKGISSVMEIPSVRIMGPGNQGKSLLEVLGSLGGSVRHETSLLQPLEENGNFFPEKKDNELKKAYLARKRAYLSRLLRTLEKDGYVTLTRKGRYVRVSLSESGRLYS